MIEEDGQLDNGETPVILETPEVPNYLPVSTTPLLTSMNQMFFKTEDKKGAVIKAASKFSLAQNSKFCRVYPCNILDKKRQDILKKETIIHKRNMSSDTMNRSDLIPHNQSFKVRDTVPLPLIPIHASTRRVTLKKLHGSMQKRLQSHREEIKGPSIDQADDSLVISRFEDNTSPRLGQSPSGSPRMLQERKVPKFLVDYMAGKPSTKQQEYKHKSKLPAPRALAKFDIHPAADKDLHQILASEAVDNTPQGNIYFVGGDEEPARPKFKRESTLSFKSQNSTNRKKTNSPYISQKHSTNQVTPGEDLTLHLTDPSGQNFSSKYNTSKIYSGFPAIPEVGRVKEDRDNIEIIPQEGLPELTLKRVVKENPNMRERVRLSSLAEVAQRYLLEKEFDRMLGGSNVLSNLTDYEYQQLLYLAPHIQRMEEKMGVSGEDSSREKSYAYFSAPPIERAEARFKKIVSMSAKYDRSLHESSLDEQKSLFQQPPMTFQFSSIPGQTDGKKKKLAKPGSSPERKRVPGKMIEQLKESMNFKRNLQEPTSAFKSKHKKSVQENQKSGRRLGMSPAMETGEGGQSIYKVEIERDEIGEAIKQLMDRGDEPRMNIDRARRGSEKKEEGDPMGGLVSLTSEDKPKEHFDEDLAKLLNEYRPKVTLWKSTLGDKLFLLDNVDKVKGHSFDELQRQLKQLTKMHH